MRVVRIVSYAGPRAVVLAETAEPVPGPADVLVEVTAAGVGYPDLLQTRGRYPTRPDLPYVPGLEVAGVVRSAPSGSGFRPGDRVGALAFSGGGFAELAAVPAGHVVALPAGLPTVAAAGMLFNDLTVHFALRRRGRLAAGETVLVHGAAGGIGTAAVRLARAFGARRIVAVVSTAEKAEVARQAGATDVVPAADWPAGVAGLLGPRAIDVVVDPVGGDRFTDSLRALAPGGRLLVLGFTAGEIPTVRVNRLLMSNVDVVGVGWGGPLAEGTGALAEQWAEIRALVDHGRLSVPEPRTYPLAEAGLALESLDRREATGKLVLTP